MLDRAAAHLKYSLRLLARSPLFAICAVSSLGIGIGANTAIFSVANALLFAPTPGVREPGRLVDIGRTTHGRGFDTVSYLTYADLRSATPLFESLYAVRIEPLPLGLGGISREPGAEIAYGEQVSASYFDVLGLTPSAGTFFRTAEEDLSTPLRKVVLSHGYWQRRFSRDPAWVGRSIVLNGAPFTIVGVGPEGFRGTTVLSPDLWVPVTAYTRGLPDEASLRHRENVSYMMTARLKPGVSVAQADAQAASVMQGLAARYPEAYRGRGLVVMASSRVPGEIGGFVTPFLLALMGVVGLVLLVACTNLAGLMLARATSRTREIAVRLALGASRTSLAGLLVTESLVLFGLGAIAALVVGHALTSAMMAGLGAAPLPVTLDLSLDWRVALFTGALALVTSLLTGLGPALHGTRANLVPDLKSDNNAPRPQRLRQVFVTAQMAFCLSLVLVAGLFLRAMTKATAIDAGFDVDRISVASVDLGHGGYPEDRLYAVADEIRVRLAAIPGVEGAAISGMIPLEGSGFGFGDLRKLGADQELPVDADWSIISPEYLAVVGLPLSEGRNFTSAERAGSPRVAILNEHFARRAWPTGGAVGSVLENGDLRPGREATIERLTIVGVAKDAKYRWLGEAPRAFMYVALAQNPWDRAQFFLRHDETTGLQAPVRRALAEYDANLPLQRVQRLREYADLGLLPQKLAASISGMLGAVALLLAAIGLYGVTAYAVASRSREIGIRLALGATGSGVMRLVLGRGLKLVAIGGAIGLAVAAGLAQLLSGLLFGVSPLDPAAYVTTVVVLGLVALAATYVPARRAAAVDPLTAIRTD